MLSIDYPAVIPLNYYRVQLLGVYLCFPSLPSTYSGRASYLPMYTTSPSTPPNTVGMVVSTASCMLETHRETKSMTRTNVNDNTKSLVPYLCLSNSWGSTELCDLPHRYSTPQHLVHAGTERDNVCLLLLHLQQLQC